MRFWFGTFALLAALLVSPTGSTNPGTITILTPIDYEPAWHPDGDQLVFVSNRGGSMKIWTTHALDDAKDTFSDFRPARRLTAGPEEDDASAWSPDGSRIAYVATKDGNAEIYVMRADGSEQTRITNHPGIDIHPHWSPDGSRILWNSSRNSADQSNPETFELFTMKRDGSDVRQLTRGGIRTYASWSPDGAKLVFRKQLDDGNSDIFAANADASEEINLTENPAFEGWPSWSRDGQRIVFAREASDGKAAKIYVMNADGSDIRILVDAPGRNTNPRWSPKKDVIVFSRRDDRQVALRFKAVNDRNFIQRRPL